jgi:ElaB/YqjD/DUF883 family membrane-anchored ribosome-binding protein
MLQQTLISINNTLDKLIAITNQDIEDIKQAQHNTLFNRNIEKDKLVNQFTHLKSQIDDILVKRSETGLDLSQIINPQEDKLLGEFKNKLEEFHNVHKKFSKMALLISNFYNNLLHKISGSEPDIGYQMQPKINNQNQFSLKA